MLRCVCVCRAAERVRAAAAGAAPLHPLDADAGREARVDGRAGRPPDRQARRRRRHAHTVPLPAVRDSLAYPHVHLFTCSPSSLFASSSWLERQRITKVSEEERNLPLHLPAPAIYRYEHCSSTCTSCYSTAHCTSTLSRETETYTFTCTSTREFEQLTCSQIAADCCSVCHLLK